MNVSSSTMLVGRTRRTGKAKPLLDDIDAVLARLPPDTVELIDIDYNCGVPRLPSLDRQSHIRYVHLGAHKLRNYSPLFTLTRLERLFLVSAPLTNLSAFQSRPLKSVRLIRGRVTHVDVSAPFVFLQNCTQLTTFGNVSIANLILQSCRRVDLTDQSTNLGVVNVYHDDTFTVAFHHNGIAYTVTTTADAEAWLLPILQSWQFTD